MRWTVKGKNAMTTAKSKQNTGNNDCVIVAIVVFVVKYFVDPTETAKKQNQNKYRIQSTKP